MGPLDAAIANKFVKILQVAEGQQKWTVHMIEDDIKEDKTTANRFKTGTELLYGGQGKITNTNNLTQSNNEETLEKALVGKPIM